MSLISYMMLKKALDPPKNGGTVKNVVKQSGASEYASKAAEYTLFSSRDIEYTNLAELALKKFTKDPKQAIETLINAGIKKLSTNNFNTAFQTIKDAGLATVKQLPSKIDFSKTLLNCYSYGFNVSEKAFSLFNKIGSYCKIPERDVSEFISKACKQLNVERIDLNNLGKIVRQVKSLIK